LAIYAGPIPLICASASSDPGFAAAIASSALLCATVYAGLPPAASRRSSRG
jgi:hypothetical protein